MTAPPKCPSGTASSICLRQSANREALVWRWRRISLPRNNRSSGGEGMDPHLMSQLTALMSVVMIDIVLAGDNAVVVGTAAAGLPPKQQRQVIMIGSGLALVARILFALVAVQLLAIIGLLLAGGLLLLWVAWKMWRELRHHGREVEDAEALAKSRVTPKTFRSAVTQVA